MFILMGREGQDLTYVKDEARTANERYRGHAENPWFGPKAEDPNHPSASDTTRVTFRGHGLSDQFGGFDGYTPEQFVDMLKERKDVGDFPDSVTTIDLIGCNIGLKKGDNPSWVEQVGALLKTDRRFDHITNINAITYYDQDNAYEKLLSFEGKEALLMTNAQTKQYNEVSTKRNEKATEFEELREEILRKQSEMKKNDQMLTSARQDVVNEQKTIEMLRQRETQIDTHKNTLQDLLSKYKPKGKYKALYTKIKKEILANINDNTFTIPLDLEPRGIYRNLNARIPQPLKVARDLLEKIRALEPTSIAQDLKAANARLEHFSSTAKDLESQFVAKKEENEQYISDTKGKLATLGTEITTHGATMQKIRGAATKVGSSQATPRAFVETLPGLQRSTSGGDFAINTRAVPAAAAVNVDFTTAESVEATPATKRISVPFEHEPRHNTGSDYNNYRSMGNKAARWQSLQRSDNTAKQRPEAASTHTTTPVQPSTKTSTHTDQAEPDSAVARTAIRPR